TTPPAPPRPPAHGGPGPPSRPPGPATRRPPSLTQNAHPGGAGGQDSSGPHRLGGRQRTLGGGGQPGGALNRRTSTSVRIPRVVIAQERYPSVRRYAASASPRRARSRPG